MSETALVDNAGSSRYELHRDGRVLSVADYRRRGEVVAILHVETDPAERGNGHSAALMDEVLDHLRANGLSVDPICPHAAAHVRDRPDHHDLLAR